MSRSHPLTEGDIIELKPGHTVYVDLPEHFVYVNRVGVFDKLGQATVVIGQRKNGMDTNWLDGRYVVISTSYEGGGMGHGTHDVYPEGHKVFAEKIPDRNVKAFRVSFYESGPFTAMNTDITPIGKAEMKWAIPS